MIDLITLRIAQFTGYCLVYYQTHFYDPNEMNCAEANRNNTHWWRFENGELIYGADRPPEPWVKTAYPRPWL